MRKIAIYSLVLCLFLAGSCAFAYFDKPRLSVRAFDNKTDENVPAAAITEMMTTELFEVGLFNLVEREKLSYVADEIALGQSGLVDPSTAPELGRVMGAQYSMTGAITVYHYNASGGVVAVRGLAGGAASKTAYVTLDLRIIDNTTSEVVYARAETGQATRAAQAGAAWFKGAAIGGFSGTYGGILASATRDAVVKHVASMEKAFR